MTEPNLTDRQIKVLNVVAEGHGRWDARRIDITLSSRYGAGEITVLEELRILERLGLVVVDPKVGVGGRWAVTSEGSIQAAEN